jgi:hypothetical protein
LIELRKFRDLGRKEKGEGRERDTHTTLLAMVLGLFVRVHGRILVLPLGCLPLIVLLLALPVLALLLLLVIPGVL